MTADSPGLTLH